MRNDLHHLSLTLIRFRVVQLMSRSNVVEVLLEMSYKPCLNFDCGQAVGIGAVVVAEGKARALQLASGYKEISHFDAVIHVQAGKVSEETRPWTDDQVRAEETAWRGQAGQQLVARMRNGRLLRGLLKQLHKADLALSVHAVLVHVAHPLQGLAHLGRVHICHLFFTTIDLC